MHNDMQRAVEEKEGLVQKLQDYGQTLARYEEAVSLKEREKSELVHTYNGLSSEAQKLNSTIQEMHDALSETQSELLAVTRVSVLCLCCGVVREDVWCVVCAGEETNRGGNGAAKL